MQQPAGAAPAAPAGAAPALAPTQPMQQTAPVPQSQVQQMQPAQAQGKQPTQDDLDYLQAHPETMDKFEDYYGFRPTIGVKPQILR